MTLPQEFINYTAQLLGVERWKRFWNKPFCKKHL